MKLRPWALLPRRCFLPHPTLYSLKVFGHIFSSITAFQFDTFQTRHMQKFLEIQKQDTSKLCGNIFSSIDVLQFGIIRTRRTETILMIQKLHIFAKGVWTHIFIYHCVSIWYISNKMLNLILFKRGAPRGFTRYRNRIHLSCEETYSRLSQCFNLLHFKQDIRGSFLKDTETG